MSMPRPADVPDVASNAFSYWTTRGFWAIADQALFAISNLIVNVLLARWLTPREYGAFVTAYVVLILVSVAHGGLLIEELCMNSSYVAEQIGPTATPSPLTSS